MFYGEIEIKIKKAIEENKIEEASKIISQELSMPYIPLEFEEKLKEYQLSLRSMIDNSKNLSRDQVLDFFESNDPYLNLKAISIMASYNLRNYCKEIQDYLLHDHIFNSKCLLADILIEQEIDYDFKVKIDDLIRTYNFKYMQRITEQELYFKVKNKLSEIFENDNPSLFNFSLDLLNKKLFLNYFNQLDISSTNNITEDILSQLIKLFDLDVNEYSKYFTN